MRVAVIGSGGVGGFVGGRLAKAGHEVAFLARGEHLRALRERGLRVRSTDGDFEIPSVTATDRPAELMWVRGKVALANGDLDTAVAMAKKLRKEQVGYATVWARMLDAGVARRRGHDARAILSDAVLLAESQDLAMCTAACRYALDDVTGEEAMRAEGVERPDRVAAMLLAV